MEPHLSRESIPEMAQRWQETSRRRFHAETSHLLFRPVLSTWITQRYVQGLQPLEVVSTGNEDAVATVGTVIDVGMREDEVAMFFEIVRASIVKLLAMGTDENLN